MDRTPYQDKIIKRYYENKDDIMQEKLSNLASELYLATGKKRDSLWKRAKAALLQLQVPEDRIEAMITADKPEALIQFLKSH